MLPAPPRHPFRLADVMTDSLAALAARPGPLGLPPLRHAIVVLVDGLGAAGLRGRTGHARTLAATLGKGAVADTVFPSTTAAALASLTTGVAPGGHGLVGYDVLDPSRDRVVNLLRGWGGAMVPEAWQTVPTVFERAVAEGVAAAAIGPAHFAGSGFSRAVLRGADYLAVDGVAARLERSLEHAAAHPRSLSYVYIPELDRAGHRHGTDSPEWIEALEETDAAIGAVLGRLDRRTGLLVTADHGMVDVPAAGHVLLAPELLAGVRHVAGEPRCLQLHLHPGVDPASVSARLAPAVEGVGWVATRAEAIAADLFGPVDPAVEPRIGDLLVGARKRVAFYADGDDPARRMVGQHGSLTSEETTVPLLRFGALAE